MCWLCVFQIQMDESSDLKAFLHQYLLKKHEERAGEWAYSLLDGIKCYLEDDFIGLFYDILQGKVGAFYCSPSFNWWLTIGTINENVKVVVLIERWPWGLIECWYVAGGWKCVPWPDRSTISSAQGAHTEWQHWDWIAKYTPIQVRAALETSLFWLLCFAFWDHL